MQKINKKEMIDKIQTLYMQQRDLYKEKCAIMDIVRPVLTLNEGKQVTKRIVKQVQDALPEYTVSYYKQYSWTRNLFVSKKGMNYDERINIALTCDRYGHDIEDEDKFVLTRIEKENGHVFKGIYEIVTKYDEMLSGTFIEDYVNKLFALLPLLKEFGEATCNIYDSNTILKMFGLGDMNYISAKYIEIEVE